MGRKKSGSSKHLPVRTSAQVKKTRSQVIFEDTVPWLILTWNKEDFGIDAIVEITQKTSHSEDEFVTGKRFSVQLKSSTTKDFSERSVSVNVEKEKITYWYNSIEPVLLAITDIQGQKIYYRWIDEQLISELFQRNENWIGQKTVTIRVDLANVITPASLAEIEEYVVKWRRPGGAILKPGSYFRYSTSIKDHVDKLVSNCSKYSIPYLQKEIGELGAKLQQAIYTIAIVGPSRSGKSTLINAMLRKNISPIGMLPTTGIPITIFPRNENSTVVIFKDGRSEKGPAEINFLKQYADQNENPGNSKNVKLISVSIINSLLEKGFALCDIPGLDDPDDDIRNISKTTIYNVNAIIYVINAAPMADGGFSITKAIIDDLKELSGRMDKVFIVFNKIDLLNNEQIAYLQGYVSSVFNKYSITKYLPAEPFFVSSKGALDDRMEINKEQDSLCILENQIWTFLLAENKTGLRKLLNDYADCQDVISKLKKIINAKLLDDETKKKLSIEISEIQSEISQLNFLVNSKKDVIIYNQELILKDSFTNILNYLRKDLGTLIIGHALPDNKAMAIWLENNAYRTISYLYAQLEENIRHLQAEINTWISKKLKQVEIKLNINYLAETQRMPEISKYTGQIDPFFNDMRETHPGILEKVVSGAALAIEIIIEAVYNLVSSNERLRKRDINIIMSKAKKCYERIEQDFSGNLKIYLNAICIEIERRSTDRTNVYLGELSKQMGKLESALYQDESLELQQFLLTLEPIEQAVQSDFIHLEEYNTGLNVNNRVHGI